MISDILSDAAAEVREYLEHQPEAYAPFKTEIDAALAAMDAARLKLDAAPEDDA